MQILLILYDFILSENMYVGTFFSSLINIKFIFINFLEPTSNNFKVVKIGVWKEKYLHQQILKKGYSELVEKMLSKHLFIDIYRHPESTIHKYRQSLNIVLFKLHKYTKSYLYFQQKFNGISSDGLNVCSSFVSFVLR